MHSSKESVRTGAAVLAMIILGESLAAEPRMSNGVPFTCSSAADRTAIDRRATSPSTTPETVAQIPNRVVAGHEADISMTVIEIGAGHRDRILPIRAVLGQGGETFVYILDRYERPRITAVGTVASGKGWVEITRGLVAGDRVVISFQPPRPARHWQNDVTDIRPGADFGDQQATGNEIWY